MKSKDEIALPSSLGKIFCCEFRRAQNIPSFSTPVLAAPNAVAQLVTEKKEQAAFLNIPKKGKVRGQFSHFYIFSMASHRAPREVTGKRSHKNSFVTVQPCFARCTVCRNVRTDSQTEN